MSISLFNDPVPAEQGGNPRLLVGFSSSNQYPLAILAIVSDATGRMSVVNLDDVRLLHEYDFDHEVWVDRYAEALDLMRTPQDPQPGAVEVSTYRSDRKEGDDGQVR